MLHKLNWKLIKDKYLMEMCLLFHTEQNFFKCFRSSTIILNLSKQMGNLCTGDAEKVDGFEEEEEEDFQNWAGD